MGQTTVNEPSSVILPAGHVRIDEPLIRQDIDRRGTEWNMYLRQGRAMADLSYMKAFTMNYQPTVEDIEQLLSNGVPVRVINGLNTGMNVNTLHHLPVGNPLLKFSTIVGLEGQKVGMMANEHAGVVAVAMALGIRDYDQLQQAA